MTDNKAHFTEDDTNAKMEKTKVTREFEEKKKAFKSLLREGIKNDIREAEKIAQVKEQLARNGE